MKKMMYLIMIMILINTIIIILMQMTLIRLVCSLVETLVMMVSMKTTTIMRNVSGTLSNVPVIPLAGPRGGG